MMIAADFICRTDCKEEEEDQVVCQWRHCEPAGIIFLCCGYRPADAS